MKRKSPSEEAGYISKVLFGWLFSLLRLGNKRQLNEDDLFPLIEDHTTEAIVETFEQKWKDEVLRAEIQERMPQLWKAMMRFVTGFEYVMIATLKVGESILSFGSSVFLWYYLQLLLNDGVTIWYSVGAVAGIGISCIGKVFCQHHNRLIALLAGMKLKVAIIGIVYKTVLSSNRSNISKVGTGKVMNFVSNGAIRMEEIGMNFMFCTVSVLDNVMALALMWYLFGWESLAGILIIMILLGLQVLLSREFAKYRKKQTFATDRRLSAMNDIVKGIRMVKMCGWEDKYSTLVRTLRRKEVNLVRIKNIIMSFSQGFYFTLVLVGTLVSVISMLYTGHLLTAVNLFTLVSILGTVTDSINLQIYGARNLYDALVSINRIEKFLLSDVPETDKKDGSSSRHNLIGRFYALFNNERKNTGDPEKTSNSKYTLLKNVPSDDETSTEIQTKSQASTVQKLVPEPHIMISQMSCTWFDKMLQSTLHNVSLEVKSNKLVIITGTVGSGKTTLLMAILKEIIIQEGQVSTQGQIAYVGQIPWIFTGTVRENILFGKPYDKERYELVLESCGLLQDIQRFPKGDMSMLGQRGVLLSGGQRTRVGLARAVYSDSDIILLDDPLSAVDGRVGQHLFDKCICGVLSGKIRILVTHQLQYLHRADEILIFKYGSIINRGSFAELSQSEIARKMILSDSNTNSSAQEDSDMKSQSFLSVDDSHDEFRGVDLKEEEEIKASGTVSSKIYWTYIKFGSSTIAVVVFLIFSFVVQGSVVAPNWWLKIVSHMSYEKQRSTLSVGIFTGLVVGAYVLSTIRMVILFLLFLRSSEKLHDVIAQAVIKSPVLFFDTNPVGRIMNRFSKDIGTMDDILPYKASILFSIFFQFIGILVVTGAVNYWFTLIILPTAVIFVYLCLYYLKTARELSRIEAVCCSPVYEHITETMEGLEVIHSLHMQHSSLNKFYNLQNMHTKAFALIVYTTRWAGIYVDIIGALFATVVGFGTLAFKMDAAAAGLVLSYIISMLRMSSNSVRQASDTETKMVSVERVKEYTKLPPEPGYAREIKPPNDWPSQGALSLRGVFMSYQEAGPCVLKDITFEGKSEEKIGIVGRTGAGKSSLVAALFRMPDPKGEVLIDGVNLGTLNIQSARSSMAVITQDPTLFAGQLRRNLDPFDRFTGDEIWTALKEVQMLERIKKLTNQLEHHLGEEGSGFSVGEKQLLCLARALLQRSKILVLDEATANVDFKTDQLIQQVIREKFVHCTVLTIAHRLNTIMDYDRVLVLDRGNVVQYDSPAVLTKESGGIFAKLLQSQGLHDQD